MDTVGENFIFLFATILVCLNFYQLSPRGRKEKGERWVLWNEFCD
jgi:hypothetical protein